ncbi:hypothetical protein Tco_1247458 [Tanacetum coccineum]
MSTLVIVDPESSTQADGAQSSRVLVPLSEHPYEAIRTTRMAVRVIPAMSSGLSASIAEVAAMSESTFRKRFRSSFAEFTICVTTELPSWKRNRRFVWGELVEDRFYTEFEDPAARDEGLAAEVEGLGTDDESHGLDDEIYGLGGEGHSIESDGLSLEEEEEEAVTRGQQQAALVMGTTVSAPLELGYRVLRCQELALEDDDVYSMFKVGQGSGSVLTVRANDEGRQHLDIPHFTNGQNRAGRYASPATAKTERFLTELGAKVEMQGGLICDHAVRLEELSPFLFNRSLELRRREWGLSEIWSDMCDSVSATGSLGKVSGFHIEQLCGMPSVICRERTEICGYSLLRRDDAIVVDGKGSIGKRFVDDQIRGPVHTLTVEYVFEGIFDLPNFKTAFPRMGKAEIVDQVKFT